MFELTEYKPGRVELSDDDLRHLLALVKGTGDADDAKVIQAITPTPIPGAYDVTPGPYVGRMGLPSGTTIDIRSRFAFEDVIELIRLSGRFPIRVDQMRPDVDVDRFVVDVVAAALTREVDRLVAFGLAKGYRPQRFTRPPYPGRPDVSEHLGRYAARPDRLVTHARRITLDTDLNRALAAALDVIGRVPLVERIGRSVVRLRPSFSRVRRVPGSADSIGRLSLDRLTARYRDALALAEIVLRSQSLVPRGSRQTGASVLFNMPKVWEAFVAKWVRTQWDPEFRVEAPMAFDLSADGTLRSEADVTVWQGDDLVALYDAKYKRPGDKPSMGDVYQMVTYCTRLGIAGATLVYPAPVKERSFRVGGKIIEMRGLSIDALRDHTLTESGALAG